MTADGRLQNECPLHGLAGSRTVRIDQKDVSTAKNVDMVCCGTMKSKIRSQRALGVSDFLLCFPFIKELHDRLLTAGQPFPAMNLHPSGT